MVIHHKPGNALWEEVAVPQSPSGLLYDYRAQIPDLGTYQKILELLRRVPESAMLIGKFVGTSAGAMLFQEENLPELFIHQYWLKNRSLEFQEASFAAVYASLESFIYDPELIRTLTIPLDNFDSDDDVLEFRTGLTACVMTPELYEGFYLRGGTFRSENKTEHRGVRSWFLTVLTMEKKIIRNQEDSAPVNETLWKAPYRLAEDLMKALRIYKKGAPTFRNVDEQTPWAYLGGQSYPSLTFPKNDPLTLHAAEFSEFKGFFDTFQKIDLRKDRFLRVAMNRFTNALDRKTPEDSVIDLSITLEALLLSGLGNEDERGNVSYRFALHGARLLAKNLAERQQIFRKLKSVYSVRSKIVHGAESYDLPKDDSGNPINIDQFCDTLELLARTSFRKFFEEFERTGRSCRIDWNAAVLE